MTAERVLRIACVAAALLMVSGCGLKGDLYVPEKPAAAPDVAEPEDDADGESTNQSPDESPDELPDELPDESGTTTDDSTAQ